MSKLIMLRKPQQPVRVHSTHSLLMQNRRRPVKQHLRQLKDIEQSENDQSIGVNAAYGATETLQIRFQSSGGLSRVCTHVLCLRCFSEVKIVTNEQLTYSKSIELYNTYEQQLRLFDGNLVILRYLTLRYCIGKMEHSLKLQKINEKLLTFSQKNSGFHLIST